MGFFSSIGKFFKKIVHGVGRVLGLVPSSADKRLQRSLLEEQQRAADAQRREQEELKRKKEQLTSMRRSIGGGRKSLLTSWYDEGTIGS
jgi:hypothetical protein